MTIAQRPNRGTCRVCGVIQQLHADGTVRAHLETSGAARWGREACPGGGRKPEVQR